jgi:two-component system OmpR family response regulator
MRIVLVEDNAMLAQAVARVLSDQGHAVEHFSDGAAADGHLAGEGADIAIVDVNLPGLDGVALVRRLRARGQDMPVMMLTARSTTTDRVTGLDAGADDYLVKPFEMAEFEARLRALARRRGLPMVQSETVGRLSFDRAARRVWLDGAEVALSRRELALFECLVDRAGQIVSKETIAGSLYGVGADVEENAVETLVSRLRRRLAGSGAAIRTARGLGYMLDPDAG